MCLNEKKLFSKKTLNPSRPSEHPTQGEKMSKRLGAIILLQEKNKNVERDRPRILGRNPVSKHQIPPEYGDDQVDGGTGLLNPFLETKFSGVNGDREQSFPCSVDHEQNWQNLTRFILTLAIYVTIHTYVKLHFTL